MTDKFDLIGHYKVGQADYFGAGDGSLPFPFGNPRQGVASLATDFGSSAYVTLQKPDKPTTLEQVTGVGPAEISLGS